MLMLCTYIMLFFFLSQIPEKIVHSSAHLLLSITTTVRPQFLLHLSSTQTLCKHASQGTYDELTMEVSIHTFPLSPCYLYRILFKIHIKVKLDGKTGSGKN